MVRQHFLMGEVPLYCSKAGRFCPEAPPETGPFWATCPNEPEAHRGRRRSRDGAPWCLVRFGGNVCAVLSVVVEWAWMLSVDVEWAWMLSVDVEWVSSVECWVLGVGCWVLGVGCWVLSVGC